MFDRVQQAYARYDGDVLKVDRYIKGAKMEDHGELEYLIKVHGIMSIKAKNLDEALDIAWEKIPDDLAEIGSLELEGVDREEC